MKKTKHALQFTVRARRDIERCRLFLWRKQGGQPARRIAEVIREARRIVHHPKLYPVESVHPISGLEFRRKNVDQFVIVYAFIEPTAAHPGGILSVRSIRHGAEADVWFQIEEARSANAQRQFPQLFIGERASPYLNHRRPS